VLSDAFGVLIHNITLKNGEPRSGCTAKPRVRQHPGAQDAIHYRNAEALHTLLSTKDRCNIMQMRFVFGQPLLVFYQSATAYLDANARKRESTTYRFLVRPTTGGWILAFRQESDTVAGMTRMRHFSCFSTVFFFFF